MMEPVFVKILFDLHCDWEGIANHKKQMAQRELEDKLVAFQNPKDEQPMI